MNRDENSQYYARRAEQERVWAERSSNDNSRRVHRELAAEYERRLADDQAPS